jgi:hypothetical protein
MGLSSLSEKSQKNRYTENLNHIVQKDLRQLDRIRQGCIYISHD